MRVLLILLCLLVLATSASAECAWVLWEVQASEKRGRMFLFDHAFASRGECEETRTVWIKIARKRT